MSCHGEGHLRYQAQPKGPVMKGTSAASHRGQPKAPLMRGGDVRF